MSGIVGLWNLNREPVEEKLLRRLSAPLAHRGPDGEGLWLQGPVGLACQLMRVTPESRAEVQPLVHPNGVVIFDGRLDNREELVRRLSDAPGVSAASPDPDLILAAYLAWGENFPERLYGDFALAVFDPHRQKLVLVRDAVGIKPLYYCRQGDTFIFASEIKAILAHPRITALPDDHMLAHLFLDPPGAHAEQTFFKNISTLPPAHKVVITPRGLTVQQYWDFDPSRQIRLRSYQEYVEAFQDLFGKAVRHRLRSLSPVAVAVSGGLDSSSILCFSQTLRQREPGFPQVSGISFVGAPGSLADEEEYLQAIESEYGIKITRVPMMLQGFLDSCPTQVRQTEAPMPTAQWNSWIDLFAVAREQGARVLLLGVYGDQVMFEPGYLLDLATGIKWGALYRHLQEFPQWCTDTDPKYFRQRFIVDLIKYLFPPRLWNIAKKLKNRLAIAPRTRLWSSDKLLREIARKEPARNENNRHFANNYAKYMYTRIRSRYDVWGMEWLDKLTSLYGFNAACPFMDRDLVAFMMAIPGEIQNLGGVPRAVLRSAMDQVLPPKIAGRRYKGDYAAMENEAVRLDFHKIMQYIHSDNLTVKQGYLNQQAFQKELPTLRDKIRGNTCAVACSIEELLGMEIWLKIFVEKQYDRRF